VPGDNWYSVGGFLLVSGILIKNIATPYREIIIEMSLSENGKIKDETDHLNGVEDTTPNGDEETKVCLGPAVFYATTQSAQPVNMNLELRTTARSLV
jgi:hypothetical protein